MEKKNYDSYNFKKLDFVSIHRAVRSLENNTHFPESFFSSQVGGDNVQV